MRVNLIKDGTVVNTILAESIEAAQALYPEHSCIEANTGGIGWHWDGQQLSPPPEPDIIITSAQVDAERDRRVNAGLVFSGMRYQTRPGDRENIQAKYSMAIKAMLLNAAQPGDLRWADPDRDFVWIAENNSLVAMDAQTMLAFGEAVAKHKEQLIFAGSQLKQMAPIPSDYTDARYWP